MNKLTRAQLADPSKIAEVVGDKCDKRWHRGRLDTAGVDGMTRLDFFVEPEDSRIKMVRDFLLHGQPGPLKGHAHRKPGGGFRVIANEMTVEHAAGYVLYDALEPIIRPLLTKNCLLYVPGRVMRDDITDVIRLARQPEFKVVITPDIHQFFDNLSWKHLRRKLTKLPLADDLIDFIMATAKAEIVMEKGRVLRRVKGIGQGLVIAPLLANLYMAETDQRVSRRLGRLGVPARRASDNFILPAPNAAVAQEALAVLEEELRLVGLKIKPETRMVHDLENRHNAPTWLGVKFTRYEAWVPAKVIEKKAAEYQREIDRGVLSQKGLEERLDHLERYYEHLVGPESAHRASRAIYTAVSTLSAEQQPKGGTAQVRQQVTISKDKIHRRQDSQPFHGGRAPCTGEPDLRDGYSDQSPTSKTGTPPRPEPHGSCQQGGVDGSTRGKKTTPCPATRITQPDTSAFQEAPSIPTTGISSSPREGQEAHLSSGEGSPHETVDDSSNLTTSTGASNNTLLVAPSSGNNQPEDDPAEQYKHRLHRAEKTAELTRAMLDNGWRIRARTVSTAGVELHIRPIIGIESVVYVIRVQADSRTAAEVEAITIALQRLHRERGVRYAEAVVTDPTLVGYFERGWRVRSPEVGKRLREMFRVVDDLYGGRVECVAANSRWAVTRREAQP